MEVADVTPLPDRGWYGIRRKVADVYEDYERDERVHNDQAGARSSDTRRSVYQEKERDVIRGKSVETRRRVRAAAFGRQPKGSGSSTSQGPLKASQKKAKDPPDTRLYTPGPLIGSMKRAW